MCPFMVMGKRECLLTPKASSKGLKFQQGQRTGLSEANPATSLELVPILEARKGSLEIYLYQFHLQRDKLGPALESDHHPPSLDLGSPPCAPAFKL